MYNFIVGFIKGLWWVLNGSISSIHEEKIPEDDTYILVAPHHSWVDPVIYILAGFPRRYTTIAKEEPRKHKLVSWLTDTLHFVTVNRKNPGPSVIKEPVRMLKNDEANVLIFPTGSRTKEDLKEGAITIARLSKKKVIPAVFVGPNSLKEILLRKHAYVMYGDPIIVPKNRQETDKAMKAMEEAFHEMENQLPNLVNKK